MNKQLLKNPYHDKKHKWYSKRRHDDYILFLKNWNELSSEEKDNFTLRELHGYNFLSVSVCLGSVGEITVDTTLDKVLKSNDYKTLRDQFRNNEKPEGCRKCWKLEEQGLKSRRQRELEAHEQHLDLIPTDETKIVLFDIKLGNHCNLKCNICNSEYSKKWEKDEMDWYGTVINPSYGKDWLSNPQTWQE